MGIINRFFLFLYTLVFALLALGVVALTFQVVPAHVLWNECQYALAQWQTGAAAFVVFLLSIHLLGCSLASGKREHEDHEVILVQGTSGEVRVAVAAVKNLVDKVARMVVGVRDLKLKVKAVRKDGQQSAVAIRLRLVIGQETNVTVVSDKIRQEVQRHLEDVVGIKDFALDIAVTDITNAPLAKKQRVV